MSFGRKDIKKMKDDKIGKLNIFSVPFECLWLGTKGIFVTMYNCFEPFMYAGDKITGRHWRKLKFLNFTGKSERRVLFVYRNFYNAFGFKTGYCKITKRELLTPKVVTFYNRYGKALGECEYSKDMDCYEIFIKFKNFNDKRGKI